MKSLKSSCPYFLSYVIPPQLIVDTRLLLSSIVCLVHLRRPAAFLRP